MSEIHSAIVDKIASVVLNEHRPVSYSHDLAIFSVGDKEYKLAYGTFRNIISDLKKEGKVEVDYRSVCAFYTLKGHRFGRPMTSNHMGIRSRKSNWMYNEINNLPLGKNSLHDIRLWFEVPRIWSILSTNSAFILNSHNKDIQIPGINIDDLFIGVKVHRTDSVSVNVGCSYAPVAIDIAGIIRLSNSLTRVEERLERYLDESAMLSRHHRSETTIPNHMGWIVKMWHFGADEIKEYGGKSFEITYADAEGILSRIYSKQMRYGKIRRRLEIQEYPDKELDEAIKEKLNTNSRGFG